MTQAASVTQDPVVETRAAPKDCGNNRYERASHPADATPSIEPSSLISTPGEVPAVGTIPKEIDAVPSWHYTAALEASRSNTVLSYVCSRINKRRKNSTNKRGTQQKDHRVKNYRCGGQWADRKFGRQHGIRRDARSSARCAAVWCTHDYESWNNRPPVRIRQRPRVCKRHL